MVQKNMDFIARAGGILQRSNRIAGLLLIVIIVEGVFMLNVMQENTELKRAMVKSSKEQKVYVVPGSMAGIYSPRRFEVLLQSFVDHVSQSLNTFTHASLRDQYVEVRKIFSPKMITQADEKYRNLINIASQDKRSSLFIPIRSTMKVSQIPDPKQKGKYLSGVKQVELIGVKEYILGDSVIEKAYTRQFMEIEETNIGPTNPFGYVLRSYREEELSAEEVRALELSN